MDRPRDLDDRPLLALGGLAVLDALLVRILLVFLALVAEVPARRTGRAEKVTGWVIFRPLDSWEDGSGQFVGKLHPKRP